MERDCKTCVYSKNWSEYDNGCTAWSCEYINRREAIEAWKKLKQMEGRADETDT